MTTHRALFVNVAKPGIIYVNPVLLQMMAGAAVQALPGLGITVVDGAAGDEYGSAISDLGGEDVVIFGLTYPSDLDELLAFAPRYLGDAVRILLVGHLVTDGDARQVLAAVASALPHHSAQAFIGRETSRFVAALRATTSETASPRLPNVVTLAITDRHHQLDLPAETSEAPLVFSESIVRACEQRGFVVLAEGLTRGCEHHCTYCRLNFDRQTSGLVQRIQGDAIGRVVNVARVAPDNTVIFFTDENFFGGRSEADSEMRLESIVRLASGLRDHELGRTFAVDTRIDSLVRPGESEGSRELRRKAWQSMAAAGLTYAYLGVESFSKSQLRRYAKHAEYPAIVPGIVFGQELGIAFTLGMIIMDPLVTPGEILETVDFVDTYALYPHVASLFKPLRLVQGSPYSEIAGRHLSALDVGAYLGKVDTFQNPEVRDIWPIIRRLHGLFTNAGYRHSDAALIDSVIPGNDTRARIPARVARMECEILRILLEGGRRASTVRQVGELLRETVTSIVAWIGDNQAQRPGTVQQKAMHYHRHVFDTVKHEVDSVASSLLKESF